MKQENNSHIYREGSGTQSSMERRRRKVESTATFGLLLVAVSLVAPFASPENAALLSAFKWIYASGALIYLVARVINVSDPDESKRLKRLRRLESWAGIAFAIASFFWFYKEYRLGGFGGSLALLHDTILFTLVGAMIQIIASWLIYSVSKKERHADVDEK